MSSWRFITCLGLFIILPQSCFGAYDHLFYLLQLEKNNPTREIFLYSQPSLPTFSLKVNLLSIGNILYRKIWSLSFNTIMRTRKFQVVGYFECKCFRNLPLDKHYIICQVKGEKTVVLKCFPISFSKKILKAKIWPIVSHSIGYYTKYSDYWDKYMASLSDTMNLFKIHHCILFFQLQTKTMPVEPLYEKIKWKISVGQWVMCWGKKSTAQSCLIYIGHSPQGLHNWLYF